MGTKADWKETPHQKLLRAYEKGNSLELSYADVYMLVQTPIRDVAEKDDENQKEFELRK